MTWKQDREYLRALKPKSGFVATIIYCLLSHMRGRLHMRYYLKYHGGWRHQSIAIPKRGQAPKEFTEAYGSFAQYYYQRSVLENLDDQAEWIERLAGKVFVEEEFMAVAERVLAGYPDQRIHDAPVTQSAECQE